MGIRRPYIRLNPRVVEELQGQAQCCAENMNPKIYPPNQKQALLKAELDWKLQKEDLEERTCFVCGGSFQGSSEEAVIERDARGRLRVHICPSCAQDALAELYGVPRERIGSELESNTQDLHHYRLSHEQSDSAIYL